jgi:uncharacterized membrane protein
MARKTGPVAIRAVSCISEMKVRTTLVDMTECLHCKKTGTCTSGPNGESCSRCVAYWQNRKEFLPDSGKTLGLVCSMCWGKGVAEISSSKWSYRYPAFLASAIVILAFALLFVFGIWKTEHFDKTLVFVSTLIGSVTGYYFGGERSKVSARGAANKSQATA